MKTWTNQGPGVEAESNHRVRRAVPWMVFILLGLAVGWRLMPAGPAGVGGSEIPTYDLNGPSPTADIPPGPQRDEDVSSADSVLCGPSAGPGPGCGWVLQAVLLGPKAVALINDRCVTVGQTVEQDGQVFDVVAIDPECVTLNGGAGPIVLRLCAIEEEVLGNAACEHGEETLHPPTDFQRMTGVRP